MPSSVDLGATLEATVSRLVKSGRYNSRSEVLRAGVRLVQEQELRLAALDAAVSRGVAEADAGQIYDLDEVAAAIDARLAGMDTNAAR